MKRFTSKKLAALTMSLVLAMSLIACGGKKEETAAGNAPVEASTQAEEKEEDFVSIDEAVPAAAEPVEEEIVEEPEKERFVLPEGMLWASYASPIKLKDEDTEFDPEENFAIDPASGERFAVSFASPTGEGEELDVPCGMSFTYDLEKGEVYFTAFDVDGRIKQYLEYHYAKAVKSAGAQWADLRTNAPLWEPGFEMIPVQQIGGYNPPGFFSHVKDENDKERVIYDLDRGSVTYPYNIITADGQQLYGDDLLKFLQGRPTHDENEWRIYTRIEGTHTEDWRSTYCYVYPFRTNDTP